MLLEDIKNFERRGIANPQPDGFGRWTQEERKLAKIRVLRNNDKVVIMRVFPYGEVRCGIEPDFDNVTAVGILDRQHPH